MKIVILTDIKNSWFIPYGKELESKLSEEGHQTKYVFSSDNIVSGDVCFLLSCQNIIGPEILKLNNNNIVAHASDLPKGKGFSPLQWQIFEGKNEIVVTLLEAVDKVDSGPYYFKEKIVLKGTELLDEVRPRLGALIIGMCLKFIREYNSMVPIEQTGEESFYKRRTSSDDELDIDKSLKDIFNHLRVADNEKHPVYFHYKGQKYNIKISKAD